MTDSVPASAPLVTRFASGLVAGVLIGIACTILAIVGLNLFGSERHAVEEAELCYSALMNPDHPPQPQMREYLKGRLYWNAAVRISPPQLDEWHIDFGAIDSSVLEGLPFLKGGMSADEVYHRALAKHPKAATDPFTW